MLLSSVCCWYCCAVLSAATRCDNIAKSSASVSFISCLAPSTMVILKPAASTRLQSSVKPPLPAKSLCSLVRISRRNNCGVCAAASWLRSMPPVIRPRQFVGLLSLLPLSMVLMLSASGKTGTAPIISFFSLPSLLLPIAAIKLFKRLAGIKGRAAS